MGYQEMKYVWIPKPIEIGTISIDNVNVRDYHEYASQHNVTVGTTPVTVTFPQDAMAIKIKCSGLTTDPWEFTTLYISIDGDDATTQDYSIDTGEETDWIPLKTGSISLLASNPDTQAKIIILWSSIESP